MGFRGLEKEKRRKRAVRMLEFFLNFLCLRHIKENPKADTFSSMFFTSENLLEIYRKRKYENTILMEYCFWFADSIILTPKDQPH